MNNFISFDTCSYITEFDLLRLLVICHTRTASHHFVTRNQEKTIWSHLLFCTLTNCCKFSDKRRQNHFKYDTERRSTSANRTKCTSAKEQKNEWKENAERGKKKENKNKRSDDETAKRQVKNKENENKSWIDIHSFIKYIFMNNNFCHSSLVYYHLSYILNWFLIRLMKIIRNCLSFMCLPLHCKSFYLFFLFSISFFQFGSLLSDRCFARRQLSCLLFFTHFVTMWKFVQDLLLMSATSCPLHFDCFSCVCASVCLIQQLFCQMNGQMRLINIKQLVLHFSSLFTFVSQTIGFAFVRLFQSDCMHNVFNSHIINAISIVSIAMKFLFVCLLFIWPSQVNFVDVTFSVCAHRFCQRTIDMNYVCMKVWKIS